MRTVGVCLIYAAVVLRAVVVLADDPDFFLSIALLAVYGMFLVGRIFWIPQKSLQYLRSSTPQFAYLSVQSVLVIVILIVASYEDFLAMLFIPLSLDAVSFFGKRLGYIGITIFSLMMVVTLLFSDVGPVFGAAMGVLYTGICFLFGGYAHQVQKAEAARARNQQTFDELQTAHRQLQGYADQRMNLAVEQERSRLARELHDSVTQTVFSMNLAAQSAHLLLAQDLPRCAGQLSRIEELAASALQEIQSLVTQLSPRSIVEKGLPRAIHGLARQMAQNGFQVSVEIHEGKSLSEAVATGLYAITHEALVNARKHSGCCEALVRLHLNEARPCLEIEDHGRGFDLAAVLDQRGHWGLTGMAERAREVGWRLSVLSQPGTGTRIVVTEEPAGAVR